MIDGRYWIVRYCDVHIGVYIGVYIEHVNEKLDSLV